MTERQQDWIGQTIYDTLHRGRTVKQWGSLHDFEKFPYIEAAKAVYPLCLAIDEAKQDQRAA